MKQMEKELKKHMDEIVRLTFNQLDKAYRNQEVGNTKFEKGDSRLVFPSFYKDKKATETRISEQELRFIFVEVFNAYCDLNNLEFYYSVETPTKDTYINFADSTKKPKADASGRCAEFDLVIFDEYMNRRCLVEFKANNASEHDHEKDFVKLNNNNEGDNDVLRYFIEVIKSYSKNGEKSTINSLKKKILNVMGNVLYYCYALEGESKRSSEGQTKGKDISDIIVKL